MANKKLKLRDVEVCNSCGEPIRDDKVFFHSRCCNAHFEGKLVKGTYTIVCEQCSKFVAFIDKAKTDEIEAKT